MPGILPMKVIKVGTSSQSRIAQACDRCRSKKIRCDGIRPCCSQCSNVGFECKTSDKLSRRAFPRGYTESLEERVRSLEGEVRELKDLLDEKDEKIDMLSKMHSNRRNSVSTMSGSPAADVRKEASASPPKEDTFRIQASPLLLGADNSDSYFMGASSGRAFVDAFKRRVQECGKSIAGFNTEAFLNVQVDKSPSAPASPLTDSSAPPRMFSDRCVNVFFQEWAPLFPVLHKPSFLKLYEEYMANPEDTTDPHKLAQLNLVFGIAGLSNGTDKSHTTGCEQQWRSSLELIITENTLVTLQCLVLALIHCILKADYTRLQHYKGIAVGLSHRLGLHQSQKRFSLGVLSIETRKKVFWTLYTVDCFSAALLGLPKLLKEDDIHAEYPNDIDDEYVTEKGFQPSLPGEYTKISSSLALFRASRILSKVLEQNYPAAAVHDLSLQSLTSLETELQEWSDSLPAHLKLTFAQGKPSTEVTGSRSALLSLAFFYIRSLIHRPAVGSTLGNKSSPSVLSLADSSKHIIQIVQLLEERNMSFSFCLNKNEMLTLCGLSLLYQGLDLKQEGKMMQESQRLVTAVIKLLEKAEAPGVADFKKLATSMTPILSDVHSQSSSSRNSMAAPKSQKSTPSPPLAKQQIRHPFYRNDSFTMSESDLREQQEKLRRATIPIVNPNANGRTDFLSLGRASLDASRSDSPMSKREIRSPINHFSKLKHRTSVQYDKPPNLDYLSLSNTPSSSQPHSPRLPRGNTLPIGTHSHAPIYPTPAYSNPKFSSVAPTDWDTLLNSLENGQTNIFDAVYGSGGLALGDAATSNYGDWSPSEGKWDLNALGMGGLDGTDSGPARSVLSFSEESLSSGEDLPGGNEMGLSTRHDYNRSDLLGGSGIGVGDNYGLFQGLENFGL